jgi:outer membrane usher protein
MDELLFFGDFMKITINHQKQSTLESRLSPLALMFLMAFPVYAAEPQDDKSREYARNIVEFESDLLKLDGGAKVDLSRFSYGSSASPGIYRVNVFVNNIEVSQEQVEFKEGPNRQVYPCLTPRLIQLINFNEDKLPDNVKQALASPSTCSNLEEIIPEAKFEFDSSEQQLTIEVPQIYVNRIARGTVNPELWDSGIPALHSVIMPTLMILNTVPGEITVPHLLRLTQGSILAHGIFAITVRITGKKMSVVNTT